jgi:hypothetical protein
MISFFTVLCFRLICAAEKLLRKILQLMKKTNRQVNQSLIDGEYSEVAFQILEVADCNLNFANIFFQLQIEL